MELVSPLPFGLILCRVNGRQVTVTGVSDDRLKIRLSQREKINTIDLHFLKFDTAGRVCVTPSSRRVLRYYESRTGCEVLLSVTDGDYKTQVLSALMEYARYIRLKEAGDDERTADILTGCPAGGMTSESLSEQKRKWFSVPFAEVPWNGELALSLDRQDTYGRFLRLPISEFQKDFFARNRLGEFPLFRRSAKRVYIGNSYCAHLFPENLIELVSHAVLQGLSVTVVLPPVRESRAAWRNEIIGEIEKSAADEIAVNDMGTLYALRGTGKRLALGTLLNRRRKDPRMKYKLGLAGREEMLSENSLNDKEYADALKETGIVRFEYESCGLPVKYAESRISLHLPLYQTNTSHGCILAANCEDTDPGLGRDEETCPRWCMDRVLLYPDDIGLTGRYNSLFGVDREILTDGAYLSRALDGVDRVVAELL